MSTVREVINSMVSPLVQSGIIRGEEVDTTTSALEKTQTGEALTTSEKKVVEEMAQHLEKEKKKEGILKFVLPAVIGYKIFRWIV